MGKFYFGTVIAARCIESEQKKLFAAVELRVAANGKVLHEHKMCSCKT